MKTDSIFDIKIRFDNDGSAIDDFRIKEAEIHFPIATVLVQKAKIVFAVSVTSNKCNIQYESQKPVNWFIANISLKDNFTI